MKNSIFILIISAVFISSCIGKEPLNAEADIIECIVESGVVKADPVITNNSVTIYGISGLIDKENFAPKFTVTPGATISPASGTVLDFSDKQIYTVTSEDGQWSKEYTVRIITDIATKYDFENWEAIGKYEEPYEIVSYAFNGKNYTEYQKIWASGNPGFAIVKKEVDPQVFPTCSTTDSKSGQYAVKLETKRTGYEPMPMAAGNLYLGSFDTPKAMSETLKATRFGLPFSQKPKTLTGWYKYKAGEVFYDSNSNVVEGKKDRCDIYAVMYEPGESGEPLYGDDVLTNERIVALARVANPGEQSEYTRFTADFEYYKPLDEKKLNTFKYNLAIVFSASIDGAYFEGAVGSTLYIDQVELICEETPATVD